MLPLDRRRFLSDLGVAFAGSLLAGRSSPAVAHTSAQVVAGTDESDPESWEWVKAQFDLAPSYVHMSSFFLASHPKPVQAAIERYRRELNSDPLQTVERGSFGGPDENLYARVKRAAAAYLGGKAEEFALTQSTTMGLSLVYQGLPLKPGQQILTTTHDHYSHHESIRYAASRQGASVKKIPLYDRFEEITEQSLVERVRAGIGPATRVVGVTWVHSQSGLKLPIRAIASALRETNSGRPDAERILLVVDGVHGLGVEDETIATTGVDIFVAGTHKWLFGPRGTGLIWAPERVWGTMRPTIPTFDSRAAYEGWMENGSFNGKMEAALFTPGGFHAFEHEWAVEAAFLFHESIGKKRVAERIHALNSQMKEGLSAMDHVTLYTPRSSSLSAGLVCFDVRGMKPGEVVERLHAKRILATETPYGRSFARVAPSLVNNPQEVDTTLRAIRELRA